MRGWWVEQNSFICLLSCSEYSYWPSSSSQIFWPRHLSDPLEQQLITVRKSNIAAGGEGAFAKTDIPAGAVVAFYNGIRMTKEEKSPYEDTGYSIYVEFVQRWEMKLNCNNIITI